MRYKQSQIFSFSTLVRVLFVSIFSDSLGRPKNAVDGQLEVTIHHNKLLKQNVMKYCPLILFLNNITIRIIPKIVRTAEVLWDEFKISSRREFVSESYCIRFTERLAMRVPIIPIPACFILMEKGEGKGEDEEDEEEEEKEEE